MPYNYIIVSYKLTQVKVNRHYVFYKLINVKVNQHHVLEVDAIDSKPILRLIT